MEQLTQEQCREYAHTEGLDTLIAFGATDTRSVFDAVRVTSEPVPPVLVDLVHLHRAIRQQRSFTVLEFGVGHSTVVMADALQKNEAEWKALPDAPKVRNRFMFQLFCVDASEHWIAEVNARLSLHLRSRVHVSQSPVRVGVHNGQLCHFYQRLPDIVPDFIYLDAPHPKDVQGDIHGLSFSCDERTVMSADLLLMESTFLPGTFIVVDGRTNNARFLERNFRRTYTVCWDRARDVTTFSLDEERLGKYNVLGTDAFGREDGIRP